MFSTLFNGAGSGVPASFYKDLAGLSGIFSAAYLWLVIA